MTLPTRIDLAVPFSRKEEAKALGARWDAEQRTWYAPPGTDLRGFDHRWLPKGCEPEPEWNAQEPDAAPEKGVSSTDLLIRVKWVVEQGHPDALWLRAEISERRGRNGQLVVVPEGTGHRPTRPEDADGDKGVFDLRGLAR